MHNSYMPLNNLFVIQNTLCLAKINNKNKKISVHRDKYKTEIEKDIYSEKGIKRER